LSRRCRVTGATTYFVPPLMRRRDGAGRPEIKEIDRTTSSQRGGFAGQTVGPSPFDLPSATPPGDHRLLVCGLSHLLGRAVVMFQRIVSCATVSSRRTCCQLFDRAYRLYACSGNGWKMLGHHDHAMCTDGTEDVCDLDQFMSTAGYVTRRVRRWVRVHTLHKCAICTARQTMK
jgi:hypothetical protein